MSTVKPVKLVKAPQQLGQGGDAAWGVVCLCAAWCGVCRQYAPDFQALQEKYPQVRFAWIDVEECEDVLGEIEVETFPTLLIGRADAPLFLGPLLPQIQVLDKLLASLQKAPSAGACLPPEAVPLWQRVAAQWQ